jgi:hypothetical protein
MQAILIYPFTHIKLTYLCLFDGGSNTTALTQSEPSSLCTSSILLLLSTSTSRLCSRTYLTNKCYSPSLSPAILLQFLTLIPCPISSLFLSRSVFMLVLKIFHSQCENGVNYLHYPAMNICTYTSSLNCYLYHNFHERKP